MSAKQATKHKVSLHQLLLFYCNIRDASSVSSSEDVCCSPKLFDKREKHVQLLQRKTVQQTLSHYYWN